jgi:glycosyltransferase involved in cell wall biosynthesis
MSVCFITGLLQFEVDKQCSGTIEKTIKKECMTMPIVSICIPAYKQPENLLRALTSVFIQTFKDYEVIITDDSPDDAVEKVIREFSQYANLRYYKNKTRKGSPENWNEAVRLASGELIKILHHDDWFSDENSLADFVNMLERNPKADFAFCPSLNCGADGKIRYVNTTTDAQIKMLHADPSVLFKGNFIGAPSATIYRRPVDQEFDLRLKWLVDIDFYIRVLAEKREFVYIRRPLVCVSLETPGKVTDECFGNKRVEVFEYLYLYTKLSKDLPLDYQRYQVIWALFDRFDVQSLQDILDCGVNFALPQEVNAILLFRRNCKRAGRRLASTEMKFFYPYLKLIHVKR